MKAENEHVELHELRGFLADDLHGAFQEAHAVSRGTRCKQFLFSLSLNPPEHETVSIEAFEAAIDQTEAKLGLEGQPRAVVFHEKEGRRHAHCVWSRIDAETMTAVNLPHYKRRLMEVSKALYLEHGWDMPRGFTDRDQRSPFNFTHAEWEQARRSGQHPKAIKDAIRECWAVSDSREALVQALSERGYSLARGDRRGFVAVDYRGEAYSLSRAAGVNTKEVNARIGAPDQLPSLEDTRGRIAARMTDVLHGYERQEKTRFRQESATMAFQRTQLVQRHRAGRDELRETQSARWDQETRARAERFSKGFRGLWDRLTGKHAQLRRQNEAETEQARKRDLAEKDKLIARQLAERRALLAKTRDTRIQHTAKLQALRAEVSRYREIGGERAQELLRKRRENTPREPNPGREPEREP